MNRNAGAATALAVVLAILGVSYLPRQGAEPQATAQSNQKAPKHEAVPIKNKAAAETCDKLRVRLRRFIELRNLPRSCEDPDAHSRPEDPHLSVTSQKLKFAIALVPNPVTTHLQLMHDSLVEVIQQAAQDDNYSYDSSWMPWDDAPKEYPLLVDQQTSEEIQDIQERQPGVLIFRRETDQPAGPLPYQKGLIVFLVSEQPTHGVSDRQFENALAWIFVLGGAEPDGSNPLQILGPTFSGTLPSLERELDTPVNRALLKAFTCIHVISGSVSSKSYIDLFQSSWNSPPKLEFQTMQESDDLILDRFLRYLQLAGYPLQNIAILSEDETGFGETPNLSTQGGKPGSQKEDCLQPKVEACTIHLYYPRDIASLRSAYEQQGIFRAGKQQPNPGAPGSTLRGDLAEPANSGHDTVRTYGGQLTPLAQESVLIGISQILRDRNIEFVIVRSTNPLDQIFLSQFLRRSNASARVVLDGVDLLFSHGAEGGALRGVMTLSTYPLVAREQDWTPSVEFRRNGSYRIFPLDAAEGTYIAARKLFKTDSKVAVPIHDYAPPMWALSPDGQRDEDRRPPTWVSVVGHRQFWPLAVLNQTTLGSSRASDLLKPLDHFDDVDQPLLVFTGEMMALMMACLIWAGWHCFCCSRGSLVRLPRVLASFAPTPGGEHDSLILAGSGLLAILTVVTSANLGLWSKQWEPRRGYWLCAWTVAMLYLSFAACINNSRIPVLRAEPPRIRRNLSAAGDLRINNAVFVMGLIVVDSFLAVYVLQIRWMTMANEALVYWRNASLISGVAPVMPMVLLIAGLYGWFWFNLQGLALLGRDRPRLPKRREMSQWMRKFSQQEAATPAEAASRPLNNNYGWSLLFFFALVTVFFLQALHGHGLRTLGDRTFGWFMLGCLSLFIALVLADIWQVVRIWARLRILLIFLDRSVLRRTLVALKGLSWGSVWAISGNVLEERYRLLSRQFESLNHLLNIVKGWRPAGREEVLAMAGTKQRMEFCMIHGHRFADWYITLGERRQIDSIQTLFTFQCELATTAGVVLNELLLPAWRKEKRSLLLDEDRIPGSIRDGAEKETKSHGDTTLSKNSASSPGEIEAHVAAAEEFFVLPYLGLIQNTLGRIRTIVLGSLCVFVSATLAVSSYPFEPIPVLGGAFLLLFLVSGAALAFVYAEMHRDATLSHLTNTNPGELGTHFWLQLFTFAVGPLLGLLTTLFPSITDFIVSWVQPSTQAIK